MSGAYKEFDRTRALLDSYQDTIIGIAKLNESLAPTITGTAAATLQVFVNDGFSSGPTCTVANSQLNMFGGRANMLAHVIYNPSRGIYEILNAIGIKIGKLDGTLTDASSATMSVWIHNGTAFVDSGENITVNDWLLGSGQTIASGKKVIAASVFGTLIVIAAECS